MNDNVTVSRPDAPRDVVSHQAPLPQHTNDRVGTREFLRVHGLDTRTDLQHEQRIERLRSAVRRALADYGTEDARALLVQALGESL